MYNIVWHGPQGKETVDKVDDGYEALRLRYEYEMAFGGGVEIVEDSND